MVTEAVIKWIFGLIGSFTNKILASTIHDVDLSIAYFPVPSPIWDYVTYILTDVTITMPFLIAWWAWRQVKA